jgi:NAD(P)-dependent dehydrogenase (short-subunit alcohol dehydrogenase family)
MVLIDQARAAMELVPASTRRRALRTLESAARRVPNVAFTAPMGGRVPVVRPTVSPERLADALEGRRVVLTGATSGIGLATARALGRAAADVILVARTEEKLEKVADAIVADGGTADYVRADLSVADDADAVVEHVLGRHGGADVLINNAGHSIRRSLDRSYERAHDFERTMALNYFGPVRLILGLMPGMRERGEGHVVNVSTMGVEVGAEPRFAAYLASKAALDAFSASAAPETSHDGVSWTTVYMPLVHTPMIKPTKLYRRMPALSPSQGSQLVQEALVERPRFVSTPVGRLGSLLYELTPGVVERLFNLGFRMQEDAADGERRRREGAPEREPARR